MRTLTPKSQAARQTRRPHRFRSSRSMVANIGATPGAYPGIVTEAQAADGIGPWWRLGVIEGLGDRVAVRKYRWRHPEDLQG